MKLYTTLNEIRNCSPKPCKDSWEELLVALGKTKADDEPLSYAHILKTLGIEDAVWCLRIQKYHDTCLFCADVAESVLPIFEQRYPDDGRPRQAVAAIRKYHSSDIDLKSIRDAGVAALASANANANDDAAAYAATTTADATATTADAYDTAYSDVDAVYDTSYNAVCAAAADAADAAANYAADAAEYAAAYAADARTDKWNEIESLFIEHFVNSDE